MKILLFYLLFININIICNAKFVSQNVYSKEIVVENKMAEKNHEQNAKR